MKATTRLRFAAALLVLPVPALAPAGTISVVTTTPDLGALAREICAPRCEIKTLAKPTEDPHFVDAKPSHIVTLNRADVLIEGGAELELGWLPPLLESSRNAKIASGAPGRVVASHGVQMLEIPATFDRSRGDVHPYGNPHFLLDPLNAKVIAAEMAEHFSLVDPGSSSLSQANLARFQAALDAKLVEWQKKLGPSRGAKIVTYHKDFAYLAARFGLTVVETLEPKPGIAPSPAHLAKVIQTMKANGVRVILVQPYQNRKTAETVARQTNGVVLDVAQQPGARPGTDTYFTLMDSIVATLATALQEKP
jgi:zinc/manganese transport system substrate-binding protein